MVSVERLPATGIAFSQSTVPVVAMETHGSNCFYHSVSVHGGQFNSAKVLPRLGMTRDKTCS